MSRNISYIKLTIGDKIVNEVDVNLNIFALAMKDWISRNVGSTDAITPISQ